MNIQNNTQMRYLSSPNAKEGLSYDIMAKRISLNNSKKSFSFQKFPIAWPSLEKIFTLVFEKKNYQMINLTDKNYQD